MGQSSKEKSESDGLINIFGAPTLMEMMVAGNEEEITAEESCEEEMQDVFSENKILEDKEETDKIPQEMGEVAQLELEQTVNEYVERKTAVGSEKNIENISKANLENEHELNAATPMLNGKTVVENMQGLNCLKQHFRHVISSVFPSTLENYKHEMHDNDLKSHY